VLICSNGQNTTHAAQLLGQFRHCGTPPPANLCVAKLAGFRHPLCLQVQHHLPGGCPQANLNGSTIELALHDDRPIRDRPEQTAMHVCGSCISHKHPNRTNLMMSVLPAVTVCCNDWESNSVKAKQRRGTQAQVMRYKACVQRTSTVRCKTQAQQQSSSSIRPAVISSCSHAAVSTQPLPCQSIASPSPNTHNRNLVK